MRVILHMGQGKTGTTALQRSLHSARADLARHGILYPELAPGAVAHHLLIALCETDDRIPAHVWETFGGLEMTRAAAAASVFHLREEIERSRPTVLVLSSETFVFGLRAEGKARLSKILAPLGGEVQPVLYVREPAALYRSRLQERMRISATVLPPSAQPIRQALEETEVSLGPPTVCAFDPAALTGGDIVQDFAARFLGDLIDPASIPTRRDNPSLSAEAILLLSRMRSRVAQGLDWRKEPLSDRLFNWLKAYEKNDPEARRLALQPGLDEAVRRASIDYVWLRDRYNIAFPEIDYGAVDGAAVAPNWAKAPLEDLVEIDRDRYDDLLLCALEAALRYEAPLS